MVSIWGERDSESGSTGWQRLRGKTTFKLYVPKTVCHIIDKLSVYNVESQALKY